MHMSEAQRESPDVWRAVHRRRNTEFGSGGSTQAHAFGLTEPLRRGSVTCQLCCVLHHCYGTNEGAIINIPSLTVDFWARVVDGVDQGLDRGALKIAVRALRLPAI